MIFFKYFSNFCTLLLPFNVVAKDSTMVKNIQTMILGEFGYSPTPQLSYGAMIGLIGCIVNGSKSQNPI